MSRLEDQLKPLDLIFTWGRSSQAEDLFTFIVLESIEGVTRGPSHVRLYLSDDRFWEFTVPTCRYGHLNEIDLSEVDAEIGQHRAIDSLTAEQRDSLLAEAERLIGTPYDILELFEHLWQELDIDNRDDSDREKFVCSSGVEHLFRKAENPFRPDDELVSPQDIRKSPLYSRKWIYGDAPLLT